MLFSLASFYMGGGRYLKSGVRKTDIRPKHACLQNDICPHGLLNHPVPDLYRDPKTRLYRQVREGGDAIHSQALFFLSKRTAEQASRLFFFSLSLSLSLSSEDSMWFFLNSFLTIHIHAELCGRSGEWRPLQTGSDRPGKRALRVLRGRR